jgi:hypothetical protein
MMHCDIELLPAVIEQAKLLLGDYSDSDVDESVRLFTTSIIVAQLKCRSIIIFQLTSINYHRSFNVVQLSWFNERRSIIVAKLTSLLIEFSLGRFFEFKTE